LAIKQVKKESVRLMLEQFIQEVKISLFLCHPNVVKFYGFFSDALHFYIMMEYMEEGTLYKTIKTHKKIGEQEAATKLAEVCQAVSYLHSLDILHRDIKPENIVISHVSLPLLRASASCAISDGRLTVGSGGRPTAVLWTTSVLRSWRGSRTTTSWTSGPSGCWPSRC
jgi:serine/threonine protein kinase